MSRPLKTVLRLVGLTADPASPAAGDVWYRSDTGTFQGRNGSTTVQLGPSGLADVHHGTDPNVARPAANVVIWYGTAIPANALAEDLWVEENI